MPKLRLFDGEPVPVGNRMFINYLSLEELNMTEIKSAMMRAAQEKLGSRRRVLDVSVKVKYTMAMEDSGF